MRKTTKHGLSRAPIYRLWKRMKARCLNKNVDSYKNYGGRGIKVCNEWMNSFLVFYDFAMSHGYRDGLSIERINVNGNYEPSNVTFIPMSEQAKNRTTTCKILIDGVERKVLELSKEIGINTDTLCFRIKSGWTASQIKEPLKNNGRKDAIRITINGETRNIAEWSRHTGIRYDVLLRRHKAGIIGEQFIAPSKQIAKRKKVVINGIAKTHAEWAKQIGITRECFSLRVRKGCSLDKLFLPSHPGVVM